MKFTTFGIILLIHICSYSIADAAGYGQACTYNENCTDIGQICVNYKCACYTDNNYKYDADEDKCVKDINECTNNTDNCNVNAACTNTEGGFTCTCNAGFFGDGVSCQDIDECILDINSCNVNTVCENTEGSFVCTCNAGYIGDGLSCQDIDECIGNTDNNCDMNAICLNTEGSFTCVCNTGYSGDGVLCQDIDECILDINNCNVNAACENTEGGFTCTCNAGYFGDGLSCQDIDECADNADNCDENANCLNIEGSFTCFCNAGYSGDGVSCQDIDECASRPCLNGGVCSNLVHTYSCSCNNGYTGGNCQVAPLGASCSTSRTSCADNNSICQDNGQNGRTCQCLSTHYDDNGSDDFGGTCAQRKSFGTICTGNPPINVKQCSDSNAACLLDSGSYRCTCNTGYHPEDSSCIANKGLGESCNSASQEVECSDLGALCIANKCICNNDHYDNNGLQPGGVCLPKLSAEECNCSTQLVIIGVVLGLIILILLVYAGYATFLIRRYRIKDGQERHTAVKPDRKSQMYVNESFAVGLTDATASRNVRTDSNVGDESETAYSSLDDNTREDKTTYDVIQSSRQY